MKKTLLKANSMLSSFAAAGLLIFGTVACGGGETREDTVATEEVTTTDDMGMDDMEDNEQVTNTDTDAFNQYDRNTDQQWDRDEFNSNMTETRAFDGWDTDRDGTINEEEYNQGSSTWQNPNASGQESETTTGTTTQGTTSGSAMGAFSDWDKDRNGSLSQEEFNQGAFDAWDTDRNGTLSSEEYRQALGNSGTTTGTGTGTGVQ